MRIFSVGLHISCLLDAKHIFEQLGHQCDFTSYSGHNHLVGWTHDNNWLLTGDHWLTEFEKNEFWNRFYDDFHTRVDPCDAILVTYPFMFTWLFKRFNKPIIAHIPIRYEYGLVHKPEEWQHFNAYVQGLVDSGGLIICSNNKFDRIYTETFLHRTVRHIPTLGAYANMPYSPATPNFLFYLRKGWPGITGVVPNIVSRESQIGGRSYPWSKMGQYAGIVHCPYAVSTMSVFEFYQNNIPTFIPSHELCCQWFQEKLNAPETILWHWNNKSLFKEQPNGTPFPHDFGGAPDPNDRDSLDSFRHWIQYSDFYDTENFPEIQLFNNVQHLQEILTQENAQAVSARMAAANPARTQRIMDLWKGVLSEVQGKIG